MKRVMMAMVMVAAASAQAQTTTQNQPMQQQLQKLFGGKNSQEKLGQGIAIASLLGCTGKTAGKEQTNAFYNAMQQVGKEVESLCKSGHAGAAKTLVLDTLKANQSQPVVLAANQCYTTQKVNFDSLAGPKLANDTELYSRWAADPALAEAEMTEQDICK